MKGKVYAVGTEAFEVEWCIHVPSDNAYGLLQLDDAKFVTKLCKDRAAVDRRIASIFQHGGGHRPDCRHPSGADRPVWHRETGILPVGADSRSHILRRLEEGTNQMTTTTIGTWNRGRSNPNKGRKLPPEPLTEAEVAALIKKCSNHAPTGIRNRALIALLWRAGLRISEALGLLPKDLDPAQCTIRVLHGKGDKYRIVGLDAGAWALLERWIDRRRKLEISGRLPVFCTLDGRPLQASYVRNLLPRLARKAGIEKRVHAHGLRHTHASELRTEGIDLGVISKQLGHASIATTARYLDHINPQQVVETMRGRAWAL